MKSQLLFLQYLQCLLEDLGNMCGISTRRDHKTIVSRVEGEGLSFLTITLTNFCKDFQKSLDSGFVAPNSFLGFKRRGGLPEFLQGFLGLIFDSSSGRLLDVPNIDAIFAVRQLTLTFGKINLPCSDARLEAAYAKYIECESDVKRTDNSISPIYLDRFSRVSRLVWADVLTIIDRQVYEGEYLPVHSSGAVAERLSSNEKWQLKDWTRRLDAAFPTWELLCPSWTLSEDRLQTLNIREPGTEIPVRVVDVPKTLKTPRIIAIEPAANMFIQQGLLRLFENALYRDKYGAFIRWDSSLPNAALALQGSIDGTLATLDLSEASDRVSNQLVRRMLAPHPHLFEAVDACRSRKADVLGHGVVRLAKFASMGSALTFPIEAMVFFTVVLLGIEETLNRPISRKDINALRGKVRVYGDDIIVPTDTVQSVIRHLEAFGFRVSPDKSFWNGKFRESCGKEYFDGHDVSICRVREVFPTSRTDVAEIDSTASLRNQAYKLGLWKAAGFLDVLLERLIPFPIVEETSPVVGRVSYAHSEMNVRWCSDRHIPLVKGVVVKSVIPEDPLDDYGALLKCLTRLAMQDLDPLPRVDDGHLERSGRPRTVYMKTGWHAPF